MSLPPDPGPDFDVLLAYLRATRNFEFGGYKRVGLARRIAKRMRATGVASYAEYQAYLDVHPSEFAELFDTILINVTAFFRDESLWEHLRSEVVPQLLAARSASDPIRVWCAGCATGQEAYTLAIVLAEAMGDVQFRERVKLYATDLDDDALATARQGVYQERDVGSLPPDIVERYFERDAQRYVFRKDLRRLLIFGRNDLMQDAPISRIDLLTCRNTLMYFDAPTQARVLARFQFALNEGGVLVLGRAETLLTHTNLFVPIDLKRRIFIKAPRYNAATGVAGGMLDPYRWRDRAVAGSRYGAADVAARGLDGELRDAAFDAGPIAQLAIDRSGRLLAINERARALFQLGQPDLGRPLQDLEVSYRPFELRSLIDQALSEGRPIVHGEVPWRAPGGEMRWFDIRVAPLIAPVEFGGTAPSGAGVSATFAEVTRYKQLQHQVQEAQAELEAAYQELQSTNEELETMNEELQSTNEELQTINDELRQRSEDLNRANAFLESVFASMRAGVAVLDRDLRVLSWSNRAEDQWGVRAGEVIGTSFFNLDIGLPVERLAEAIRGCLGGAMDGQALLVAATNRRGRAVQCRVTVRALIAVGDERPHGVLILIEELQNDVAAEDSPAPSAADGDVVSSAGVV
ncbi:MAG TPA: CheR family methyltransferase [Gemmatirosa sp.]